MNLQRRYLSQSQPSQPQRGFSLIELLVAVMLGLLLLGGLVSVMLSVSNTSRVTQGTARIQENARFALAEMARRVRTASEVACLSFTGTGRVYSGNEVQATEAHRTLQVMFDATGAEFKLGQGDPTSNYPVDSASFVRGFECDPTGACTPDLSNFTPLNGSALPSVAISDGGRARGTDVLYLRHLTGNGMRVVGQSSIETDSTPARVELASSAAELGVSATTPVLLTDCATSVLAKVQPAGNELVLTGNFGNDELPALELNAQARAFNFDENVVEAIYYVGFREVLTDTGPRLISSLMRGNGREAVVIADGVERFDVLYHVEDIDGGISVLDASQVDTFASCRPVAEEQALLDLYSGPCGWRSLVGIEIHLLANSVEPVDNVSDDTPFRYPWTNTGDLNTSGDMEFPAELDTLMSGLPPRREMRAHFSTFVAMRNRIP